MNPYRVTSNYTDSQALDNRVSKAMRSVYLKMFFGLIVSALVSLWCATTPSVMTYFFQHSSTMWIIMLVELGLVFGISAGINKLSSPAATALFYLFSAVNGLALSPIFIVYTSTSIAKTFFIAAATFGAMSIFGYTTKQDLTKIGSILFMALIGLIIVSVVNIFTKSTTLDWIISAAGVLIFIGLTAWDTQKIKQMAAYSSDENTSRLATIGALSLYLDFINLFLYLLRFFGNQRD